MQLGVVRQSRVLKCTTVVPPLRPVLWRTAGERDLEEQGAGASWRCATGDRLARLRQLSCVPMWTASCWGSAMSALKRSEAWWSDGALSNWLRVVIGSAALAARGVGPDRQLRGRARWRSAHRSCAERTTPRPSRCGSEPSGSPARGSLVLLQEFGRALALFSGVRLPLCCGSTRSSERCRTLEPLWCSLARPEGMASRGGDGLAMRGRETTGSSWSPKRRVNVEDRVFCCTNYPRAAPSTGLFELLLPFVLLVADCPCSWSGGVDVLQLRCCSAFGTVRRSPPRAVNSVAEGWSQGHRRCGSSPLQPRSEVPWRCRGLNADGAAPAARRPKPRRERRSISPRVRRTGKRSGCALQDTSCAARARASWRALRSSEQRWRPRQDSNLRHPL